MALSVKQCMEKLKEAHRDLYPAWYIEDQGAYLFALLKRGVSKEEATINLYSVDSKTGNTAGPIPTMMIFGNEELADKLENPHKISGEDQALSHTAMGSSDFLMHYGIPGMKWGVRRFQNEDGSLTPEGRIRYGYGKKNAAKVMDEAARIKGKVDGSKVSKVSAKSKDSDAPKEKLSLPDKIRKRNAEFGDKILDDMSKPLPEDKVNREETRKGGVDAQRIATEAIFTVINPLNAAVMAADGVLAVKAKKDTDKYFKVREEKSELDPKTGLYMKKEGAYTEKEDLAAVNPGFRNMNTNTKNNCMLCTTTMDMRKRGYDVTSQLDSAGFTFADINRWYPKAKVIRNNRFDENGRALKQKEYVEKTMNSLLKQGDGARGNLMVWFKEGGGHSIFYEVQNGKVVFRDGQANMNFDGSGSFLKKSPNPEKILNMTLVNSYARLDNVEPDLKRVKAECVR